MALKAKKKPNQTNKNKPNNTVCALAYKEGIDNTSSRLQHHRLTNKISVTKSMFEERILNQMRAKGRQPFLITENHRTTRVGMDLEKKKNNNLVPTPYCMQGCHPPD